jgi:hypothetical protein
MSIHFIGIHFTVISPASISPASTPASIGPVEVSNPQPIVVARRSARTPKGTLSAIGSSDPVFVAISHATGQGNGADGARNHWRLTLLIDANLLKSSRSLGRRLHRAHRTSRLVLSRTARPAH